MNRKKLLIRVVSLIFSIFIVNFLASKFYWYSAIWYFDMIMHFAGGFWVALASIWLFSKFQTFLNSHFVFKTLLAVFLIGVSWELFEIIFYNYIAGNPFDVLDTSSDIIFDIVGGFSAILYFFKRIMLNAENTVQ